MTKLPLVCVLVGSEESDVGVFRLAAYRGGVNLRVDWDSDGRLAIATCCKRGPEQVDVVVVDGPPDSGAGLNLLRARQAMEGAAGIPVVVLSDTLQSEPRLEEARRLGATRIYAKPVAFAEWIKLVREIYALALRFRLES